MAIQFFNEEIQFKPKHIAKTKKWLAGLANLHRHKVGEVNYIFCSDEYLHQMNIDYLEHDTLTDIITFDNSEAEGIIDADIFISIERVRENAQVYSKSFDEELLRVLSHGMLHLLGFKDKTDNDARIMREKEEEAIKMFHVEH